jgi:hypothetical protein
LFTVLIFAATPTLTTSVFFQKLIVAPQTLNESLENRDIRHNIARQAMLVAVLTMYSLCQQYAMIRMLLSFGESSTMFYEQYLVNSALFVAQFTSHRERNHTLAGASMRQVWYSISAMNRKVAKSGE